jgi:SAM-dependent methyltransferase
MIAKYRDEQRLAFGQVAQVYDRVRPSYPPVVVDAVLSFAGASDGRRILEVGAGTGKATTLLAQRGLAVLALEPDPAMAAVARVNCAGYPGVEIVEIDFEGWPVAERFAALVSAAAWHWVAPEVRYVKAHQALVAGGALAAIWSLPDWERCSLRTVLSETYRMAAAHLAPDFPMHPDSRPTRLAGDWPRETAAGGRFCDPQIQTFAWTREYDSTDYTMLLGTHQDHILLSADRRSRLLAAITETIDAHGGMITLPLVTRVCLARRALT